MAPINRNREVSVEKKTHIMVVDDDQSITKVVERMFEDAGYVVTVANDGNSALAMLAERKPDLVLLDIRLPDKSGIELLAEIKTRYPDTAVIMATAVTDTDTAVQCLKGGAYDYVTKPFNFDEIVLCVQKALEFRRLYLENREYQQHFLRKVEEQLRVIEVKYRSLFEDSMDGVYISTRDGKFVEVNQAMTAMFGYSREEMIGMDFRKVYVNPDGFDKFQQDIEVKGYLNDYDMECHKQDGTEIYCVLTSTIERDKCGSILGYQGIVHDLTERKQAEAEVVEIEALKRTNQAKSELLANVSHELRTPLASIKGFIETLIETDVEWSKEQQLDFLQSANKEADRLTLLIRDLLDMSRIDSGKLALDKRAYSIGEILDSVSGVLSIITKRYKLNIKHSPDLPNMLADKVRIGQVITNLVENATKFAEEGSQIVINTSLNDGEVIVSVKDSGIGMPPEVVSNLFNRFFQANIVASGKTRGTGLGLSICKGIVEAHGGKIWVESQPGIGSRFSFSIPVNNL
jgi:PAS domain S-box-containing protein